MIALAILFSALVVLLRQTSQDIWASNRAKLLSAATNLARGAMFDAEEKLLHETFQQMETDTPTDCSDPDFPRFKCSYVVEKVELPSLAQMQTAEAGAGGEDKSGVGSNLAATIGGVGGGNASASAGASLIQSQFEMISTVLEQSIRKVTLTMTWQVGGKKDLQKMVVVSYFTDPKAVDQAVGAAGLGGPPPADPAAGGTGGTGGTGGKGGTGGTGGTRK